MNNIEKVKQYKVVITLSLEQNLALQKLRAAILSTGLYTRIPSTTALAGLVFQHGLDAVKAVVEDALEDEAANAAKETKGLRKNGSK